MAPTNVVNLKPKSAPAPDRVSERKWGKQVMSLGFCIVPSLLLRAQHRLGINAAQLAVLLQLAEHWWKPNQNPWPAVGRLADRLSLGRRQVQRYLAELEEAGYISRIGRTMANKGKTSNEYDLSGLVRRLGELAPEFAAAEGKVEAIRQEVRKKGLKKRSQGRDDA